MSDRGVIIGRIRPGAEEQVAAIFREFDGTELTELIGVRRRTLHVLNGVYVHIVDTHGDFRQSVSAARDHPLFVDISDRLRPFIEPLDPATWRSPQDAFASEFYSWRPTDEPAPAPTSDDR
jgi:hypothetical protein